MTTYDLEERLLTYAAGIMDLTDSISPNRAGNHIAGQLLRSGTSPYPNHGEAQSAESSRDFIHKMGICLKEFRETYRWLRLLGRANAVHCDEDLRRHLENETDELIRIFFSSIRTARGSGE